MWTLNLFLWFFFSGWEERGCRCVIKAAQRRINASPVCLLEGKKNIGYLLQETGSEPRINVYTGLTRQQRILGYLQTWSARVKRLGLSLWQKGLAWLRPALCQLIMPVRPDARKEPLLKLAPLCTRIATQHPKNLIFSYGRWSEWLQLYLGFFSSFIYIFIYICIYYLRARAFVGKGDAFFCRLICHGKATEGLSLWQKHSRSTSKQGSALQTLTRSGYRHKPPRTTSLFRKG